MDKDIVLWLQENRIIQWDPVFVFLTDFVSVVTAAILGILFYQSFIKKSKPHVYFWFPTISLIITAILVNGIKFIIRRPRPFQIYDSIEQLTRGGGYSFPSGHTAEVFTLLFSLWLLYKKPSIRIVLLLWAFFIGYSRISFGVHYPSDILGGIAVAALSVFITKKFILPRLPILPNQS